MRSKSVRIHKFSHNENSTVHPDEDVCDKTVAPQRAAWVIEANYLLELSARSLQDVHLQVADDDIVDFLKDMNRRERLDDTLRTLMPDQDARFISLRMLGN